MREQEIIRNLQLLGEELAGLQLQSPVRLLMIGGAYMITQFGSRVYTEDIDVLVYLDRDTEEYRRFKGAIHFIAHDVQESLKWLSDTVGDFMEEMGKIPRGRLWLKHGMLEVYIPEPQYILVLKILAARRKDAGDIETLFHHLKIKRWKQVESLLRRYVDKNLLQDEELVENIQRVFAAYFGGGLDSDGFFLYNKEERRVFMGLHSLQTMRVSFEEICQGQSPWIPLGKFMHDWYELQRNCREALLIDPLPDEYPQAYHKWAAFCAASVRWFCSTYEIPCPSWVDNPKYVLSEPWYMDDPPALWEDLRKETAEEFSSSNIYCGNRVYTNKYERDERGWPLRSHPVDLQERLAVVRRASERLARKWAEEDEMIQEYLALKAASKERKLAMQQ